MKIKGLIIVLLFITSIYGQKNAIEINSNLKQINRSYGVKSSILVYNQQKNKLITNDSILMKMNVSPVGTFHLYEALIGLESGIIKDTSQTLSLDATEPRYPNLFWNEDQTVYTALKHQTPWYFKKIANNIKHDKMQNWLTLMGYGNKDLSGGIDAFWLNSSLLITPRQQFDFLKRLYYYNLPFSFENMRFIRHAFTCTKLKNKNLYTLKVSDYQNGKQLSWYIGYVEYINNTYLFVHCIEGNSKKKNQYFETIQSELLHASLKELGILDDEMCGKL